MSFDQANATSVVAAGFLPIKTDKGTKLRAMSWDEMRDEFPEFIDAILNETPGLSFDDLKSGGCGVEYNPRNGRTICVGGCSRNRVCSEFLRDRDDWPWACRCIVI